jgi:predicted Rossmann fold nucleotide-binding protein DprA/Smf involved in DNA uptake
LQEDAVAIVGSRKAGKIALEFTDRIARKSVGEHKVVVSGFAKGVDQQALDSALLANGKSIIVLPQGILTFSTGFKKYYAPIVEGNVLVLSTFFPKAGWDVGLAMARNTYIYGLAKEIFVAESDSKGGTWEGVMDGLKRNRLIYVRNPEPNEKNANLKLIESGAAAVGMSGERMQLELQGKTSYRQLIPDEPTLVNEEPLVYMNASVSKESDILNLLGEGIYSAKEIISQLKLDWSTQKLSGFLKKNPDVRSIPGKPIRFTANKTKSLTLF